MNNINIFELEKILNDNNVGFLCGNGFSINFDSQFRNIFDRLFITHKKVLRNYEFDINSQVKNKLFKRIYKNNLMNVLTYTRNFSEIQFYKIFDDGIVFAESILENDYLIKFIEENKLIRELTFGVSQLSLLEELYSIGKKYGARSVNIEYWTILIYFYFIINNAKPNNYYFPENNLFLTLIKVGSKESINLINTDSDISKCEDLVYSNGFNNYYRLLFSTAIFNDGDHLNLENLGNINNLHLDKIKEFLSKYKLIFTLNYDLLLEQLLPTKQIIHLHGEFIINRKEYVYNQSLGLKYNNEQYVSFSNILVGDYFINKTQRQLVNSLSQKFNFNKNELGYKDLLEVNIKQNKLNTFVIFGMNIQNDQHILRTIMTGFYFAGIENPKIIYCYFSSEDKCSFEDTYTSVITFGKELSDYSKDIDLKYINTNEILKNKFLCKS